MVEREWVTINADNELEAGTNGWTRKFNGLNLEEVGLNLEFGVILRLKRL